MMLMYMKLIIFKNSSLEKKSKHQSSVLGKLALRVYKIKALGCLAASDARVLYPTKRIINECKRRAEWILTTSANNTSKHNIAACFFTFFSDCITKY